MASVSRQIGWSQESNLLYQILNQLTRLTSIIFGLKPKYKVYTALLTQVGELAPEAIVLENTIGNISFAYESVGVYAVNSSNLFIEDKTSVDIDPTNYDYLTGLALFANETIFSLSKIRITTTLGGAPADDLLIKNRIEIRVYS
jgi:hypothetical protein